jgi:hypothetical protein
MPYREIITVCYEIHIKHINTLCEQKVELLNVKAGGTYVHTVSLRLLKFKIDIKAICELNSAGAG